jgi:hypothetical protein
MINISKLEVFLLFGVIEKMTSKDDVTLFFDFRMLFMYLVTVAGDGIGQF